MWRIIEIALKSDYCVLGWKKIFLGNWLSRHLGGFFIFGLCMFPLMPIKVFSHLKRQIISNYLLLRYMEHIWIGHMIYIIGVKKSTFQFIKLIAWGLIVGIVKVWMNQHAYNSVVHTMGSTFFHLLTPPAANIARLGHLPFPPSVKWIW